VRQPRPTLQITCARTSTERAGSASSGACSARAKLLIRLKAVVCADAGEKPAGDDEQARRVRLPLLGKGAVVAHRFDQPLAAEMDDDQQS
jgi:hypothetical protein